MTRPSYLFLVLAPAAILVFLEAVAAGTHDGRFAALDSASVHCSVPMLDVGETECAFLAENEQLMDTMMQSMRIAPSGVVDVDFAKMMIPHHQGAIDMALLELRYGRNERLRRIAQEIIIDQRQEIDAMKLATGDLL